MVTIVSGTPRIYQTGIKDKSRKTVQAEREAIPTFLAKVFGYAKSGPLDPQLVVGNSRTLLYGVESFDERGKYATHATVLSNTLNAKGNIQMFQRVFPKDGGPKSTLRVSLDLLATQVPQYQRNSDGSIVRGDDGLPVPVVPAATVPGYKARWVVRQIPDGQIGQAQEAPGGMTDGANQSVLYPFHDLEVPYFGGDGNNVGLRMWAQTVTGLTPFDERLLSEMKVYPFRMACLKRDDELSTGVVVRTQTDETSVQATWKQGLIDRNTDAELYVGDVFIQAFDQVDDPNLPPLHGPFGTLATYDTEIAKVLGMVYAAEAPLVDEFSDITGTDPVGELYMMNLIGGFSSKNVPYHSFILDTTGADTVRMSENSVFYARGGSDGTMNEAEFAKLVSEQAKQYSDPTSELMNSVVNCESIIIDSGFPLETKYDLIDIISIRKDTAVLLSTHDVLGETLTPSEESSIAVALRTRLQLFPESEVHGTAVVRGMVVGHSGEFLDSKYSKRLPLTLEIAKKAADYMGAADGRWKAGLSFDSAPLSEVTSFKNVNATFKPDSVRNLDWKNCLVWVQSFKRRSVFFPALKTCYDDDTSVLNSFFTMMACVELEKVGYRAWLNFTGSDKRTNPVLKKDVEKFINDDVKDRFDGRFVIIPEVFFTQADTDRGYSWSTRIKLGAANMKTVNTFELEAYRMDDLVQAQTGA
ncbi:putative tail shealth protein [Ralstonia phage RP12]|uniref:Putative tail shealth protein n=1 Tax=Ralstonia phage RP12 TaxID=1923889 RepID=A0A1L7N0L6_9CAUD|nr:tail sheath [Ralstonia phage RP12]BAW19003.1 putative tail shealth protein [Ralstonia phage RP12]